MEEGAEEGSSSWGFESAADGAGADEVEVEAEAEVEEVGADGSGVAIVVSPVEAADEAAAIGWRGFTHVVSWVIAL